jgi:hypothetical protein
VENPLRTGSRSPPRSVHWRTCLALTSWPIKQRFAAGYETVFLIIKTII